MKAILLALTCVFVLCGCKPGQENGQGGNDTFSEEDAAGRVQMQSFTVQSGRTRIHPIDGNKWLIELYREELAQPCGVSFPPEYYIVFSATKLPGTYPITSSNSVSFVHSLPNSVQANVATSGEMVIDRIQDGYIVGKIRTEYDSDNYINGVFWARICD